MEKPSPALAASEHSDLSQFASVFLSILHAFPGFT
jgi:hypothetical protein